MPRKRGKGKRGRKKNSKGIASGGAVKAAKPAEADSVRPDPAPAIEPSRTATDSLKDTPEAVSMPTPEFSPPSLGAETGAAPGSASTGSYQPELPLGSHSNGGQVAGHGQRDRSDAATDSMRTKSAVVRHRRPAAASPATGYEPSEESGMDTPADVGDRRRVQGDSSGPAGSSRASFTNAANGPSIDVLRPASARFPGIWGKRAAVTGAATIKEDVDAEQPQQEDKLSAAAQPESSAGGQHARSGYQQPGSTIASARQSMQQSSSRAGPRGGTAAGSQDPSAAEYAGIPTGVAASAPVPSVDAGETTADDGAYADDEGKGRQGQRQSRTGNDRSGGSAKARHKHHHRGNEAALQQALQSQQSKMQRTSSTGTAVATTSEDEAGTSGSGSGRKAMAGAGAGAAAAVAPASRRSPIDHARPDLTADLNSPASARPSPPASRTSRGNRGQKTSPAKKPSTLQLSPTARLPPLSPTQSPSAAAAAAAAAAASGDGSSPSASWFYDAEESADQVLGRAGGEHVASREAREREHREALARAEGERARAAGEASEAEEVEDEDEDAEYDGSGSGGAGGGEEEDEYEGDSFDDDDDDEGEQQQQQEEEGTNASAIRASIRDGGGPVPRMYTAPVVPRAVEPHHVQRIRFGLGLYLCHRLRRSGELSDAEARRLKRMVLSRHRFVWAALEAFEKSRDVEDTVDTMKQVLALEVLSSG